MRDKRTVDELSVEELERILAIRKRQERQQQLQRMKRAGRVVNTEGLKVPPTTAGITPAPDALPPALQAQVLSDHSQTPPAKPPVVTPVRDVSPRFEDDEEIGLGNKQHQRRFWRSFANQVLLLIEVAAVVGLIYLGYQMFTGVTKLEKETASAQALADQQRKATMPTLAPTPQIQLIQVVLPGGHTPPTAPGGARFNYSEIPANLLPLVQNQINTPIISRPPPTTETALRLSIPRLNVDQTIVQGTDWDALKLGIGQLQNGANPGDEKGNVVLSAHNDIYGEYFRYLDKLTAGDEFTIRTQTQFFTYRVTHWDVYKPTDVQVLESRGSATATLISCYPYQVDDKRLVVFAVRVD
jgi:sortase A